PALRPPRSTKLARPSYTGMAIRTARSNSSLPSRLCVEQVTSKQTECQACPERHPRLPLSADRVQIDDVVFAGQPVRDERALPRPEPDDARASLLVRGVLQVRRPAGSHVVQDLPVGELRQASGGEPVGGQLRVGPRRQVALVRAVAQPVEPALVRAAARAVSHPATDVLLTRTDDSRARLTRLGVAQLPEADLAVPRVLTRGAHPGP